MLFATPSQAQIPIPRPPSHLVGEWGGEVFYTGPGSYAGKSAGYITVRILYDQGDTIDGFAYYGSVDRFRNSLPCNARLKMSSVVPHDDRGNIRVTFAEYASQAAGDGCNRDGLLALIVAERWTDMPGVKPVVVRTFVDVVDGVVRHVMLEGRLDKRPAY